VAALDADWQFRGWYMSLQRPMVHTASGIDTVADALAIVVDPAGTWHWTDEDDFAAAQRRGFISLADVASARAEGERARHRRPAVADRLGSTGPLELPGISTMPAWRWRGGADAPGGRSRHDGAVTDRHAWPGRRRPGCSPRRRPAADAGADRAERGPGAAGVQVLTVGLAAITPCLIFLAKDSPRNEVLNWLQLFFPALAALCAGASHIFHWREDGVRSTQLAESLRSALWHFQTRTGDIPSSLTDEQALDHLVARIDELNLRAVAAWSADRLATTTAESRPARARAPSRRPRQPPPHPAKPGSEGARRGRRRRSKVGPGRR